MRLYGIITNVFLNFVVIFIAINSVKLSSVAANQFEAKKKQIAVCVCGQIGRWQPQFLLDGLILPNNHAFDFHIFFILQVNNGTTHAVHSTGDKMFASSKLASFSSDHVIRYIHHMFNSSKVDLHYVHRHTHEYWKSIFHRKSINVFVQYNMKPDSPVVNNILNMYHHHTVCAERVKEVENKSSTIFDNIILTREDVYFFNLVNLTALSPMLKGSSGREGGGGCDLLVKNCLAFGGYNLRFYLFTREAGLTFLSTRLTFIMTMHDRQMKVANPEVMERLQASNFDLTGCAVPFQELSVTAVRHVIEDSYCFYDFEVKGCHEKKDQQLVLASRCEDINITTTTTSAVSLNESQKSHMRSYLDKHQWQLTRLREIEQGLENQRNDRLID